MQSSAIHYALFTMSARKKKHMVCVNAMCFQIINVQTACCVLHNFVTVFMLFFEILALFHLLVDRHANCKKRPVTDEKKGLLPGPVPTYESDSLSPCNKGFNMNERTIQADIFFYSK